MDQQLKDTLDEMNKLAEQLKAEAREMQRNIGLYRWIKPTVEELIRDGHIWQKWYAWRPVKDIHGKWHWRKDVYRLVGNTYMDHDSGSWYHYGTIFDVLKTQCQH